MICGPGQLGGEDYSSKLSNKDSGIIFDSIRQMQLSELKGLRKNLNKKVKEVEISNTTTNDPDLTNTTEDFI